MADETTLAEAPVGTDTTKTETPAAPVNVENDGIVDLDALEEVKPTDDTGKPEAAGDKKAGEEEQPKKPSGAQRAKIRNERLLAENAELNRRIEELARSQPAAKTAGESEDKPPREEDFNGDWFAFQQAKTAFEAGKAARDAVRKEFETREQSERTTKQTEIARERTVAHLERVEDAREVIADFDQTMKAMDGVQVRQDVIDEIMSSDKSALLAYHLAKHPDKLNAMNQMSGRELAREMGRLEATVKLPEAKRQTSAPAPLSAVKGGAAPSSPESDLAAWMKKTYG
jgi:hypothetical protein